MASFMFSFLFPEGTCPDETIAIAKDRDGEVAQEHIHVRPIISGGPKGCQFPFFNFLKVCDMGHRISPK
jgi:hypothetical protein